MPRGTELSHAWDPNDTSAGTGLFIAFIGMQAAGIVVADPVTLVTLGDGTCRQSGSLGSACWLLEGCWVRRVPGSLLVGIGATTALAMGLGHAAVPGRWMALPEVSGTVLQWDLWGAFDIRFLDIMLALLFVDFFDTIGDASRGWSTRWFS